MNSKREKTPGGEKGRLSTYFAPAERRTGSLLEEQAELVARDPLIRAIEEVIDGHLLILNPERQIIAVNQQFLNLLGLESCDSLVGDRPGEVLGCIHSAEGPGGCGTSRSCRTCGAVLSILTSQRGNKVVVGECLFSSQKNGFVESNEFRIRATPVQVGSFQFTVLVFNDISGQKRRETLERVFFHDILNTIGWLKN